MKTLTRNAANIFGQLLTKLATGSIFESKAPGEGFVPLTISLQDEVIETPFGNAKLYRLWHHYRENGHTLVDPEMYFLVSDQRLIKNDFDNLYVIPCYFLQDSTGVEEESIRIEAGRISNIIPVWQAGHVSFANQWLQNIKRQGYIH